MNSLKAPFPWFGGKSRVADLVWDRFGPVENYVEPFFGSGAVLLGRPRPFDGPETINDLDAYVANFWRAVQADPEGVEACADWPVSEADLHARHVWLLAQADFRERMLIDPAFYDVRVAGWWVWGISSWIGSGWCDLSRTNERTNERTNADPSIATAHLRAGYPSRKIPHLSDRVRGVGRVFAPTDRPTDRPGNCQSYTATEASTRIAQGGVFDALASRLRGVRVTCGDWSRIVTPSVTTRHGVTGVLLDPPYDEAEHAIRYSAGTGNVSTQVREWAVEHGNDPLFRIALCGYDGEHNMPGTWECVAWKAAGGYGSQGEGAGRANARRERIWFSPHCAGSVNRRLFAVETAATIERL